MSVRPMLCPKCGYDCDLSPRHDCEDELVRAAQEVLGRVDIASNGFRNTDDWHDPVDNLSAPEGMSYWEWIQEAEDKLVKLIRRCNVKRL